MCFNLILHVIYGILIYRILLNISSILLIIVPKPMIMLDTTSFTLFELPLSVPPEGFSPEEGPAAEGPSGPGLLFELSSDLRSLEGLSSSSESSSRALLEDSSGESTSS
jgi:hypothetical protein